MCSNLLIVEDEALVGLELSLVLTDLGHHVIGVAADAAEALELAQSETVDLALVDLNLADGATGAGVGRRLAAELGATVVFTTANPGLLEHGVEGAVGVLPKPYDPAAVECVVRYALARRAGDGRAEPPRRLRVFNSERAAASV